MGFKYKFLDDVERDDIMCHSLTLGYLYDVEKGVIKDDMMLAIMDGTNLSDEEVRSLRTTDAVGILDAIKSETYPNSDNDTDDVSDKKKP